jgi:hypothetical protein
MALIDDLETKRAFHAKWRNWDFMRAQVQCSVGIAAAIASSFLIGLGEVPTSRWKWLWALIAVLPAAVVLIDRTFKHSARSNWHALYEEKMESFIRRLRDQNASPDSISKELDKFAENMHKLFPSFDSSHIPTKAP